MKKRIGDKMVLLPSLCGGVCLIIGHCLLPIEEQVRSGPSGKDEVGKFGS